MFNTPTMNDSIPYQFPILNTQHASFADTTISYLSIFTTILSQILSQITISRVIILVLVLGNIKNVPFIWHLRIVNAFRFCCRTQRPQVPLTSEHIFQPIITTSHAPLMEIDFNLHKTNSSYFSDIDIARTHLVCTLFSTGIENQRGGTSGYNRGGRPLFGLALGAVSCSFKRELKPYEPYEMWTRILSWDEKWVYIVTHFVRKGQVVPAGGYSLYPQQNAAGGRGEARREEKGSAGREREDPMASHPAVVATALSKCVFKSGRRTVSPALMLKLSGLLPTASLDDTLAHFTPMELPSSTSSDSGVEMDDEREESALATVERERQRGMRVAVCLAQATQEGLEGEFDAGGEALGRHTDGTGVAGVVSTLCQLAGLSRRSIL